MEVRESLHHAIDEKRTTIRFSSHEKRQFFRPLDLDFESRCAAQAMGTGRVNSGRSYPLAHGIIACKCHLTSCVVARRTASGLIGESCTYGRVCKPLRTTDTARSLGEHVKSRRRCSRQRCRLVGLLWRACAIAARMSRSAAGLLYVPAASAVVGR